jgi:presenilin-like A22 family membrane protease
MQVLGKDGWISFLNSFNILYIALLPLDLFRALEFFPGIVFIALAFYFISQFFLYPYWWYFEFACSIMVCVGVSAEQVLLGSINQSIERPIVCRYLLV